MQILNKIALIINIIRLDTKEKWRLLTDFNLSEYKGFKTSWNQANNREFPL